jgi:hypothetical protein
VEKTILAQYNGISLEFISGKYKGGHFSLPPNSEIIIGRSGNIQLVIDEILVSRRHATISTMNNSLKVRDLGSTNGTFVNGMQVKETDLALGDRILIGSSIMRVVSDADSDHTMLMDITSEHMIHKIAEESKKAYTPPRFEGNIQEIPLPDLVQMLCSNKNDGLLRLDGKHKGFIRLHEGEIWDARLANQEISPFKAWCRMLSWESGRFQLETDTDSSERRLQGSVQALLLEGLQQADELKDLICNLPDMEKPLRISHPLKVPLKVLSPQEFDVLQAVYNHGTIESVMAAMTMEDYKICEFLLKLIENHYLEVDCK